MFKGPLPLLIILLILSVYARATSMVPVSSINKPKVTEPSSSVFRYLGDGGVACTGSFISNDGLVVSASHCLETCYERGASQVWKGTLNDGASRVLDVYGNHLNYPMNCQITKDDKIYDVEVLAGPKGLLMSTYPNDVFWDLKQYFLSTEEQHAEHKENWAKAFYDGWGRGGDIVIFKIKDFTNDSCLPIAEEYDPKIDDYFSLSFPYYIAGSKDKNHEMQFSSGQLVDEIYIPAATDVNRAYISIPESPRHLVSNIEAYAGSSGAALLSDDLKIHGILSFIASGATNRRSQARYIGVDMLWELVQEDVKKQIQCPQE